MKRRKLREIAALLPMVVTAFLYRHYSVEFPSAALLHFFSNSPSRLHTGGASSCTLLFLVFLFIANQLNSFFLIHRRASYQAKSKPTIHPVACSVFSCTGPVLLLFTVSYKYRLTGEGTKGGRPASVNIIPS